MTHLRAILAIIGGGALGVLAAELILGLGPLDGAVCIAVTAACVIGIHLVCRRPERQAANKRQRNGTRPYGYRSPTTNTPGNTTIFDIGEWR